MAARHLGSDTVFEQEDFSGQSIQVEGKIERSRFIGCRLIRSGMSEIQTMGCEFEECDFTDASLHGSCHRKTSFLNCRFAGAKLFASTFIQCRAVGCDFDSADLDGVRITEGDWSYSFLRFHRFDNLDLSGVRFVQTDLQACSFIGSDLRKANLTKALVQGTDFTKADLRDACLDEVDLKGATFNQTRMSLDGALVLAVSCGVILE